jgi:hypothetical protein
MKILGKIAFAILVLLLAAAATHAAMPLDLITVLESDSAGGRMIRGCMSPGDLDGDGYSEVFAAELGLSKRLLIFSGGNPPNPTHFVDWGQVRNTMAWIPDINGDGKQDFALVRRKDYVVDSVEVWFGGSDFLAKPEPQLVITHPATYHSSFGQALGSGDINGDGQNDLIVGDPNAGDQIEDGGRFYVYYGGFLLDTLLDESINVFYPHYNDFIIGAVLGDIDGDGLVDLAFWGQSETSGYAAILLGAIPMDSIPDYTLWSPTSDGFFGQTIVSLGDLNKDGYDDFAVAGQASGACIFYGGNPLDTVPVTLQESGDRIANIGDINHDGWNDIGVGFPDWDFGRGFAYIYYGSRMLDTVPDLLFPWEEAYPFSGTQFGYSVGSAGDFDGDGIDDVAISAFEGSGSLDPGYVYIYAGSDTLPSDADEVEDDEQLPAKYCVLHQNYPNPFNSGTVIEYELQGISGRQVDLAIYNVLGQKVRALVSGRQAAGSHLVFWDGADDTGRRVFSGMYIYVLTAHGERVVRKAVFLK